MHDPLVACHAVRTHRDLHVVRNSEVNAVCLPGGKMLIHTGLLQFFTEAHERGVLACHPLAALDTVIAHEMSHAICRCAIPWPTGEDVAMLLLGSHTVLPWPAGWHVAGTPLRARRGCSPLCSRSSASSPSPARCSWASPPSSS